MSRPGTRVTKVKGVQSGPYAMALSREHAKVGGFIDGPFPDLVDLECNGFVEEGAVIVDLGMKPPHIVREFHNDVWHVVKEEGSDPSLLLS